MPNNWCIALHTKIAQTSENTTDQSNHHQIHLLYKKTNFLSSSTQSQIDSTTNQHLSNTTFIISEQHNDSQDDHERERDGSGWERSRSAMGEPRVAATPPTGKFPMQNTSHVKFETPKVPVIFVLGKLPKSFNQCHDNSPPNSSSKDCIC